MLGICLSGRRGEVSERIILLVTSFVVGLRKRGAGGTRATDAARGRMDHLQVVFSLLASSAAPLSLSTEPSVWVSEVPDHAP